MNGMRHGMMRRMGTGVRGGGELEQMVDDDNANIDGSSS